MSDGDIYLIKIITDREIIRNFQTTTFTVICGGEMFFLTEISRAEGTFLVRSEQFV